MEAALIIYLISVAASLKAVFGIVAIGSALIYGLVCMFLLVEEWEPSLPNYKPVIIIIAASALISVTLPDKKTSYMMAAGYFTQQAVQSEHAKELSKAILKKLEEYNG